jgi:TRAP-type mannitol/chloroaromatic compound transport system permease large subunit
MVLRIVTRMVRLLVLLLVVLSVVVFGLTSGSDYLHAMGKTCLIVHHGWNVHFQCGVPKPSGF